MKFISQKISFSGIKSTSILQDEDIVYFKKTNFSQIKTDDIIMTKKRGNTSIAKVIYRTNKFLITKGASENHEDPKIYKNQVIGKATHIRRRNSQFDINHYYLFRSSIYLQEIIKVNRALQSTNVDFLFLKGLPLHLYFEKTYPKRIYRDCDILVDKKQFNRACMVLKRLGYKEEKLPYLAKNLKDLPEKNYYIVVEGLRVTFDIHREIVFTTKNICESIFYPKKDIDEITSKFLGEKISLDIQNEKLPALSFENFFIYTALHLSNHDFRGTFRYELLKKVVGKKELNYKQISETINRYQLKNYIHPCLVFLSKYYQIKLPYTFIKSVKPDKKNVKFIQENILNEGIFIEHTHYHRITIADLIKSFYLSPYPLYKKVLKLLNIKILLNFMSLPFK